jgi:hypothetical protein
MSLGVHINCDVPDCKNKVFIERAAYLVERVYPVGTAYLDVDDCVLEDGLEISAQLEQAAVVAGWTFNRREWCCVDCHEKRSMYFYEDEMRDRKYGHPGVQY